MFGEATTQSRCQTLCSSPVNWTKLNCWKSREHVHLCPIAGDSNEYKHLLLRRSEWIMRFSDWIPGWHHDWHPIIEKYCINHHSESTAQDADATTSHWRLCVRETQITDTCRWLWAVYRICFHRRPSAERCTWPAVLTPGYQFSCSRSSSVNHWHTQHYTTALVAL